MWMQIPFDELFSFDSYHDTAVAQYLVSRIIAVCSKSRTPRARLLCRKRQRCHTGMTPPLSECPGPRHVEPMQYMVRLHYYTSIKYPHQRDRSTIPHCAINHLLRDRTVCIIPHEARSSPAGVAAGTPSSTAAPSSTTSVESKRHWTAVLTPRCATNNSLQSANSWDYGIF